MSPRFRPRPGPRDLAAHVHVYSLRAHVVVLQRLSCCSVSLYPSSLVMAESQAEKTAEKPFKRLPVDVLPRNYRLELKPDLTAFTFQGTLEITTEVGGEREGKESREKEEGEGVLS